MAFNPVHVGVVGAGMISDIYLKNMIERFDILKVDAICANHMENAVQKAKQFGIAAKTFEEMLADDSIEMIVNLTPTPAHGDVIRRALEAGKHVYTEKTLTGDHESAMALRALAAEKGLYLGSAPDTFLGAALQTARYAIDSGLLGDVNSFAIASNRDNRLLNSFFRITVMPGGGVGYDYSVYYLTALVSLLGGVKQVAASVRTPYPTHIDINPNSPTHGKPIETPNESEICALLKLRSGACGTLHFNNDSVMVDQAFFAIYGTKGILYLTDPDGFGGEVRFMPASESFDPNPRAEPLENRFHFAENSRGVGPADMALAIREGRPCRADAAMACHVLEVIDAIMASGEKCAFVDIASDCPRPAPLKANVGELESLKG